MDAVHSLMNAYVRLDMGDYCVLKTMMCVVINNLVLMEEHVLTLYLMVTDVPVLLNTMVLIVIKGIVNLKSMEMLDYL